MASHSITPEATMIESLYEKACQLQDSFDYELAVKFCLKILSTLDASHIPSLQLLGSLSVELGDLETALKSYRQLIDVQVARKEPSYLPFLSLAQLHSGQEALAFYESAVEILSQDVGLPVDEKARLLASVYCSMAEIYYTDLREEQGADLACQAFLEKAKIEDGNAPEVYYTMSQALLSQDDREGSLAALQTCLSLWSELSVSDPHFPSFEHRLNFSQLAIELQSYEDAIELLEELLEEADDSPLLYYYLGLAYHLHGCAEESLPFLRTAQKMLQAAIEGEPDGEENEYQDMLAHLSELLHE